jgi:hypothetical protein
VGVRWRGAARLIVDNQSYPGDLSGILGIVCWKTDLTVPSTPSLAATGVAVAIATVAQATPKMVPTLMVMSPLSLMCGRNGPKKSTKNEKKSCTKLAYFAAVTLIDPHKTASTSVLGQREASTKAGTKWSSWHLSRGTGKRGSR